MCPPRYYLAYNTKCCPPPLVFLPDCPANGLKTNRTCYYSDDSALPETQWLENLTWDVSARGQVCAQVNPKQRALTREGLE